MQSARTFLPGGSTADMMTTMQDDADRQTEPRALLAELGTAMIATGQPVQEIEEELTEVSARLGFPEVQTAVGPTGLMVSLTPGSQRQLNDSARILREGKGRELLARGEFVGGAYLVLAGELDVYTIDHEGREASLYRVRAGGASRSIG